MRKQCTKSAALAFSGLLAVAAPASAMNWQEGMAPSSLRGTFYSTCSECRVDANGISAAGVSIAAAALPRDPPSRWVIATGMAQIILTEFSIASRSCAAHGQGHVGKSSFMAMFYLLTARTGAGTTAYKFPLDRCPSMNLENMDGRLRCIQ